MKVYVYLFTLITRQLVLSLETVFVLVLVCVKLVLIYYLWMFKLLWFVWNELKPKWTIIELLFRDKILPLLISCVDFSGLSASRTSSKQIFDIYWHGFWLSGWLQCALYWMCAFVLNDGNAFSAPYVDNISETLYVGWFTVSVFHGQRQVFQCE